MKHIILLSTLLFSSFSFAQKSRLIGTWQLCDNQGNLIQTGQGFNENKIITAKTFTVMDTNDKEGVFLGMFYGSYTLEKNNYTETLTYTAPNLNGAKGTVNKFHVKFIKGLLHLEGTNNPYHQYWKKKKD